MVEAQRDGCSVIDRGMSILLVICLWLVTLVSPNLCQVISVMYLLY
jgi:hypothetical protein